MGQSTRLRKRGSILSTAVLVLAPVIGWSQPVTRPHATPSRYAGPEQPTDPPPGSPSTTPKGIYYDIVYVRAPRYGDDRNTRWPEVKDPIQMEPGSDLILLHPDRRQEVLVTGGHGAVVDPYVSFDARWVYYAKFHDLRPDALNRQRRRAPRAGADIYKIHLETRETVRLTHQEWTPNLGAGDWSYYHEKASYRGKDYLGYGIFNLGPCPLPGGKIMFTSSRNGFLPNKSYTFPNLQLFVMDDDGRNVELIGHLNLGSALHPTILHDGRVMFSSYEAQGLRDPRLWALWAIWPDGRKWQPLMSAFEGGAAFHFMTQTSDGSIVVCDYYNQNNNGFGTLVKFPSSVPSGVPPFGDADERHPSNPKLVLGRHYNGKPRYESYSFSPRGIAAVTEFAHGEDQSASKDDDGDWMGKVTHPSAAPRGGLLLVWSPGPANNLSRPVWRPYYDGGIYALPGGKTARTPKDLVLLKNDSRYNEMQPRPVVPYRDIYGLDAPFELTWLPNDGSGHRELPAGTPFGLVGTSTFYKRDSKPGRGSGRFDGLDPFNTSQNGASTNWGTQGADAGRYTQGEIYAVRLLAMEPTSHRSYGRRAGRNFRNHANERLRILGEVPLRKKDAKGRTVLDPEGNPDTSFLVKIPADVPFTFQTLDKDGLVLNVSQTWHQVRPGEVRTDCGGCHAHSQVGLDFAKTAAARADYTIRNLAASTPLLRKDEKGRTVVKDVSARAVDVEYYRDIKPLLGRSCVKCHAKGGTAEAGLVLDDEEMVRGYENTWYRLADDAGAKYGRKPVIRNGTWRQTNASRYVRKFQSRRSLLIWKVFGRRLDGWSNDDHPTESVPGDPSTLPEGVDPNDADIDFTGTICPPRGAAVPALSEDEKITFARWVDLGCPINREEPKRREYGWFLDDLRPTLTVSLPRAGRNAAPLREIRFGAFDYYSGLEEGRISVKADFPVSGHPPGTELRPYLQAAGDHVWKLTLDEPLRKLPAGTVTVSAHDRQGNITRIERSFSVDS